MKTKPEISMSLDAALGTSASVIITRLWQDRRWVHNGIYILTPASLRRACRLLQGQSPFGEVCEWKVNRQKYTAITTCERDHMPYYYLPKFCPNCGRRVKEAE